jgi:hypothetical protein
MNTRTRQTIAKDPLDTVVPARASAKSGGEAVQLNARQFRDARPVRATFHIPAGLVEEARDAVDFLSGPPLRMTLSAFVESAIRNELDRLRTERNHGKAFPQRPGELRKGRRINAA